MFRLVPGAAVALALVGFSTPREPAAALARDPVKVAVLRLDGAIQPAALRHVERGLRQARKLRAELVVLELDTPGGLLVSLRDMTTAVTGSELPVAVYVTPAGARAASAGFFLLIAADVAAMAPGTNAGAAHPVAIGQPRGGQDIAKATEDAAALARALASRRGRSVAWSERAVRESLSYTAEEARAKGLIDVVASDRDALLRALDGRTVRRFDGSARTLSLARPVTVLIEPTLGTRLLMVLADPQLAYLLLMLGVLGLFVELFHPGAIVPGVVGGVSLLLALYAFSVLPVSWVGAALIALGIGMLVAEAFVASYGLLGLAGLASFVIGSLMLIDTPVPALRVGLGLILPVALVLGATTLLVLTRALRMRRQAPQSGLEAMVGEIGDVIRAIDTREGEGKVFVHGEIWNATAAMPLPEGARVRIEHIEGSRLRVAPLPALQRPAP